MALTKQDINQIGGLLDKKFKQTATKADLKQQSKAFEKRFDTIEKRLDQTVTKNDLRKGLAALNQSIERGFADQKTLIENAYPSREEFEELRNEVDELRDKVEALEKQQHLAA